MGEDNRVQIVGKSLRSLKSTLFWASRPLRDRALRLSAMWHRPRLWRMSRSEKSRPRMATGCHMVIHGWPHGRPRMATWSSTNGHRVVHGWPQDRPRMAQPVHEPAVRPRELTGTNVLKNVKHREARRPRCVVAAASCVPALVGKRTTHWNGARFHKCCLWSEARGDSTVADLGQGCYMPVVVERQAPLGSDRAETRGDSTSAHGPDCAETRGDSTSAFLGQGC